MNISMMANSWMSLATAIIFGVLGTISLKLSHGIHRKKAAIYLVVFYTISFVALTFAMKHIHLSVVYAVWSGAGTLLVAIIGFFYFNERVSLKKIVFLILIIMGVIGMHLSDGLS